MHRVLRPQTSEVVLPPILSEQMRVERIDVVDRELIGGRYVGTEPSLLELGADGWPRRQPFLTGELGVGHDLAFWVSAHDMPC